MLKANWYQVIGTDGSFLVLGYNYCHAIKRAKRKRKVGRVHAVHKLD